ncbi:MAG: ubiquinol oxidase subunit II [Rhabdochlamydiaceae bacterium]|nr:ubiquinol oxidase subunit II [Rhabdochlamydiaceae bacterium]
MKKSTKITLLILIFLGLAALTVWYVATHNLAVLDPQGMIGEKERDLIITASLLMLIVVVPVFVLTWAFAWKYREENKNAKHTPDWEHNYIAEYCWWGVPVIIIVILGILTWKSSHELNPFTPIESENKPIVVQAISLEWKWLFLYPELGIATINFLQFPEKTPINFEITSDAPMNSFWIPALGGQIYAMPAMRSKLHLIANKCGSYRGASSNISGDGFAGMTFTAKSCSNEEFDQWVKEVKQSPKQLNLNTYNKLLEPSQYDPVAYFVLDQNDLFDQILMKYMKRAE